MRKAVLISINPDWCDFIKNGIKTVEVRKSRPKLDVPFKVYIFCTIHGCSFLVGRKHPLSGNGKVVGEFICNKVETLNPNQVFDADAVFSSTCLTSKQIIEYSDKDKKTLYFWHISNLKIYDKPKELSEFEGLRKTKFGYEPIEITRPPQSWRYVEEREDNA